MKPKRARRYPRRPIAPPIEGRYWVTRVDPTFDRLKSATLTLQSTGPFVLNRLPGCPVTLVESP